MTLARLMIEVVPMPSFLRGGAVAGERLHFTHTMVSVGYLVAALAEKFAHLPAKEEVVSVNSIFNAQSSGRGFYLVFNRALYAVCVDKQDHRLFSGKPAIERRLLNAIQRRTLVEPDLNCMSFSFAVYENIFVAVGNRIPMRDVRLTAKKGAYYRNGFGFVHGARLSQKHDAANLSLINSGGLAHG